MTAVCRERWGSSIGDEREESLEVLELYVYTLRLAAIHCLGDGWDSREGDGAQGEDSMGRLRDLRVMVITFAFFVKPMKTCTRQRRCSVCQTIVVRKSDSGYQKEIILD